MTTPVLVWDDLIEIFSRARNPSSGTQWRAEAGPISLQ